MARRAQLTVIGSGIIDCLDPLMGENFLRVNEPYKFSWGLTRSKSAGC
jgi:hypothetical protein